MTNCIICDKEINENEYGLLSNHGIFMHLECESWIEDLLNHYYRRIEN